MRDAARFQTGLGQGRIDFQILVEKEVAQDGDAPVGKLAEQRMQSVKLHDAGAGWEMSGDRVTGLPEGERQESAYKHAAQASV